MVKVREDMTGWVMKEHGVPNSRLTVIEQVEDYVSSNGTHRARWLCECSCEEHKRITAVGTKINNGYKLSCGCYVKERIRETLKKYNKYSEILHDDNGDYLIGYTLNTNREFYIDFENYIKIKDHCWTEVINNGMHKIESNINGHVVTLHGCLGFKNYDHKDRNELNNRKHNLRRCSHQENSMNTSIRKDNTSGITGVYWSNERKKWAASIMYNQKTYHLGRFVNKEDAIVARLKAEKEYFGEFAPQRDLFEQYGIE